MIKHITRAMITIFVIIILIIITSDHSVDDKPRQAAHQSVQSAQVQLKEKVPSKYDQIDFFIDTEKSDAYRLDSLVPVTNNEMINHEIEAWIKSAKQTFINELPENYMSQASFELVTIIETENKSYNRLIFQIDKVIDANEKTQQEKVFNVDLAEGKILTLNDFFDFNDQVLQSILKHALELVEEEEKITIKEKDRKSTRLNSSHVAIS